MAVAASTARPAAAMTTTIRLRMDPPGGVWLEDGGLGVGAEDLLETGDDLALGGVYARAVEKVRHQVGVARGGLAQRGQGGLDRPGVAAGADGLHAADLLALEGRVDVVQLELALAALGEVVDADEDAVAAVVLLLEGVGGVGDLALREAALDGLGHAAELVDLREVLIGAGLELVRQRLDEVRAAERVDRVRRPRLVGDDLLGAQRD